MKPRAAVLSVVLAALVALCPCVLPVAVRAEGAPVEQVSTEANRSARDDEALGYDEPGDDGTQVREAGAPESDGEAFDQGVSNGDTGGATRASNSDVDAWTTWGSCEWGIDTDGCLWMRPRGGEVGGELTELESLSTSRSPWYPQRNTVRSFSVVPGCTVKLPQDVSYLFYGCQNMESCDLSGLDASSVTIASSMFSSCSSLSSLDAPGFITSAVVNMASMFDGCSSLDSLGVSGWDTSSVTNMTDLFRGCSSLDSLDVSGFDTSSVTSMGNMFGGCSSLGALDVSGWDTSCVTSMEGMFRECSSLTSLDVSGWNTSSVKSMGKMFRWCNSLSSIDVSGFNTSSVTNMSEMFAQDEFHATSLAAIDVSGFDTTSVRDMSSMFRACSSLTSLDLSGWDTSSVTTMRSMFANCSTLTYLDVSGFNTSSVRDMGSMFSCCSSLTSLDVSGFDTSSVTTMNSMFYFCRSLTSLDVSGFDTSSVTDMGLMFRICSSLPYIDVSAFDTTLVTSTLCMFEECTSLTALDMSGWNTSRIQNAEDMFGNGTTPICSWTVGPLYAIRSSAMVPDATAENGKWWSVAEQAWLTKDEIVANRSGIADTYTSYETGSQNSTGDLRNPRVVADTSMESGQVATWDCVWLGSYPQTYVDDAATVAALDAATGWDADGDITYGGVTYRRLQQSDATYSSADDGYWSWPSKASPGGWCYFRWEPVKWRVLEANGTTALVVSDVALDGQRYNEVYTDVTWATCTLRQWLNGTFWDDCFSVSQQDAVIDQMLVNADSIPFGTSGGASTTDRVYLLAESDVWNGSSAARHGFVTSRNTYDEARRCKSGDYAHAMGTYNPDGDINNLTYFGDCWWWWLRSPGYSARDTAGVSHHGDVAYGHTVTVYHDAVRPALSIDLSSPSIHLAGTVSSDGTMDETPAPYAGAKGSGAPEAEPGGDDPSGQHFPSGYAFLKDSYSFKNFEALIPYGYWKTIYREGAARLFFRELYQGGVCYGMSLTTASILQGHPHPSSFVKDGVAAGCVRDLVPNDVFGSYGCSMVSLSDGLVMPIDSFIKYAQIYQYSTECSMRSYWRNGTGEMGELLSSVRAATDAGALGIVIGLGRKGSRHAVLAIGYEGNDILVDDPNNPEGFERITVNGDGTWEFSGRGNYDSSKNGAFVVAHASGITRPYEILRSGRAVLVARDAAQALGLSEGDAVVEGMNRLDDGNVLVRVEADGYAFGDDAEVVALDGSQGEDGYLPDGGVDTAGMYWVLGASGVEVTDLEGDSCTVAVGAEDVLITAAVAAGSSVSASGEGVESSVEVDTAPGSAVELSFETPDEGGEAVTVTLSGTAADETVTAASVDEGYAVEGLTGVTATIETSAGEGECSAEVPGGGPVTVLVDEPGSEVSIAEGGVAVESVSLDRESLALTAAGEQAALVATVLPEDADDRTVTWASSDLEVATVSEEGVVTAVANGACAVTATAADGVHEASCAVTVDIPVTGSDDDVSHATVAAIPDQTYTGEEIRPTPEVELGGVALVAGTDYHLSYLDNEFVGKATVVITGQGDYEGMRTAEFTIVPASVEGLDVLGIEGVGYTYTGAAQRPEVTVEWRGSELEEGTDYSLSFGDAVDAGTVDVTLTGKWNFTGTRAFQYEIARADIAGATAPAIADQAYTGSAIEPDPPLSLGANRISASAGYEVAYGGNVDVGTATITFTGNGNLTGTKVVTFDIVPADISPATVSRIADRYYAGSAIEPPVTVRLGDSVLRSGTDYALSYANNTKVGTATITVKGKGNYTGTKEATFKIVRADLSKGTVAPVADKTYTGSAIKPAPTVKVGGRTLKAGTDYALSYKGNTNVGTATVTITGKGGYAGTKEATFKVVAASLASATVSSISDKAYTGGAIKPTPTVKVGTRTLKAGTDYTLSYANNTKVGTASITITGKGNYAGTRKATFKVVAASVAKATVAAIADKTYTGSAIKPSPTVKVGGRTLKSGTDYSLSYANNTKVGTATVTITGKGNYAGTKKVTFKVVAAAISKATVAKVADQKWSGKAVTPSPKVTFGGKALAKGTDYTLSYTNNTKPGIATITVTGRGNFKGTRKVTFKISEPAMREFPDVPKSHWAHDQIGRAAALGIINGYADGTYGPSDRITRAQIAVMFWNMTGKPEPGAGARRFSDVTDESAYYYKAVAWAGEVGVVNGYPDGSFGPYDDITREQLCTMAANYATKVGKKRATGSEADYASMPDAASVHDYARPAVGWAYREGVLPIRTGRLDPQAKADRAQAAWVVMGTYDFLAK